MKIIERISIYVFGLMLLVIFFGAVLYVADQMKAVLGVKEIIILALMMDIAIE